MDPRTQAKAEYQVKTEELCIKCVVVVQSHSRIRLFVTP